MTTTLSSSTRARGRRRLSDELWFAWIVGMWAAFFAALTAERLDEVWHWVRDLPLVLEALLWLATFPWLLGTAVWTSSWSEPLRLALVALFAAGWTLAAVPRRRR